ncbi:hypothetical protein VKT23_016416 [Stygiomarasmius scandens]|uniref:Uncharacterized protein n=1 Tax=Marasmiellus scandens TaxID=2682957 RepID=A0ABR1IZ96_9AGAR
MKNPVFHRLSIHYCNQDPCDAAEENRRFPATIMDMEVIYTSDEWILKCFAERNEPGVQWELTRSRHRRDLASRYDSSIQGRWNLPSVQRRSGYIQQTDVQNSRAFPLMQIFSWVNIGANSSGT